MYPNEWVPPWQAIWKENYHVKSLFQYRSTIFGGARIKSLRSTLIVQVVFISSGHQFWRYIWLLFSTLHSHVLPYLWPLNKILSTMFAFVNIMIAVIIPFVNREQSLHKSILATMSIRTVNWGPRWYSRANDYKYYLGPRPSLRCNVLRLSLARDEASNRFHSRFGCYSCAVFVWLQVGSDTYHQQAQYSVVNIILVAW